MSVLSHPKTKIFIAHGGLNSFYESLELAVPLIIKPAAKFGD